MAFSMMAALGGCSKQKAPEIKMLDINELISDEHNFYRVTEDTDIEEQNALLEADMLEHGVQSPIIVTQTDKEKFKIVSGHRRTEICRRLVKKGHQDFGFIPAIVKSSTAADSIKNIEIEIALIMSNATTRELSDWEKVQQVSRLQELYKELKKAGKKVPGRLNDLIAEKLHISKTQAGRYSKINKKLSANYKKELKEGNIAVSTADALSSKPPEEQERLYKANPVPKLNDIKAGKKIKNKIENNKKRSRVSMDGMVMGVTDENNTNYCPKCGTEVYEHYADGSCKCDKCGYRFFVIEHEESTSE